MSDVFDNWADRILDGARLPSEVVRRALYRHLDDNVRRAAEHRFRQYSDVELREGVPALLALLAEETGVAPAEPDASPRAAATPWPAEEPRHKGDDNRPPSQPLRAARYELSRADTRAAYNRAGGSGTGQYSTAEFDFGMAEGSGGPATPALTACELLARTGDPRAAPLLAAVFANPGVNMSVRRAAGRALLVFEAPWILDAAPTCVAMITTRLKCPSGLRVQWQAVRLLGKIGSPLADPAVPALTKILFESDALVLPPLAALALGGIGTPEARAALERLDREFVPGVDCWDKRDSADRGLIRRATSAALGLGPTPDVQDLDDDSFRGCDMRRRRREW